MNPVRATAVCYEEVEINMNGELDNAKHDINEINAKYLNMVAERDQLL